MKYLIPFLFLFFSNNIMAEELHVKEHIAPNNINGATIINSQELLNILLHDSNYLLLDNRKPKEYETKGFIETAINIDDTKINQESIQANIKNEKTKIIFYCSGIRCLRSANSIIKTKKFNLKNPLYWYRDGFDDWSKKKLPIKKTWIKK